MKRKLLSLVVILTFVLTACGNKSKIDLDLSPKIKDDKVIVEVKTNLPKETKASLTLINKSTGYLAQDEFSIDGKKTMSSEFSKDGKGLDKGEYSLSLIIPVTEIQPKSVKKIVGINYDKITSDYLVKVENYKYLEKNITFIIE